MSCLFNVSRKKENFPVARVIYARYTEMLVRVVGPHMTLAINRWLRYQRMKVCHCKVDFLPGVYAVASVDVIVYSHYSRSLSPIQAFLIAFLDTPLPDVDSDGTASNCSSCRLRRSAYLISIIQTGAADLQTARFGLAAVRQARHAEPSSSL